MRRYCDEAMKYGDVPEPVTTKQKNVLVILNPVADKKSASESVCFSANKVTLNSPVLLLCHLVKLKLSNFSLKSTAHLSFTWLA